MLLLLIKITLVNQKEYSGKSGSVFSVCKVTTGPGERILLRLRISLPHVSMSLNMHVVTPSRPAARLAYDRVLSCPAGQPASLTHHYRRLVDISY